LTALGRPALAANEELVPAARYERVTAQLYRGPQPSEAELDQLAAQGVKTIVDLRFGKRHAKQEIHKARMLGLNYIHMPLGYLIPSKKKIKHILSIIRNPKCQPVFLHCHYGQDRTGMVVAIYQVQDQGTPLEEALKDMQKHKFKPWLLHFSRVVAHFDPGNTSAE
jgi:protein tyrosine/serine phosphatase